MRISLGVLADAANLSREGKLNILGEFNIIYTRGFPGVHPSMQLVLKFTCTIAERGTRHQSLVRLFDTDGQQLLELAGELSVPQTENADDINIVSIIGLTNIQFMREGNYHFSILADNHEIGTVPFKVAVRQQQPPPPPQLGNMN